MLGLKDFIHQSNQIDNQQDLIDLFIQTLKTYGIEAICYFIFTPYAEENKYRTRHIFTTFPKNWSQYYLKNNLYEIDPTQEMAQRTSETFHWDACFDGMKLSKQARQLLVDIHRAGFTDGLMVPVHGPAGSTATFSLSTIEKRLDFGDTEEDSIKLLCKQFHEHFLKLEKQISSDLSVKLSPREREILQWAAQGKSDSSIAEILGISQHTVDTFIRRAFDKLRVDNRITAIVKALSTGEIRL